MFRDGNSALLRRRRSTESRGPYTDFCARQQNQDGNGRAFEGFLRSLKVADMQPGILYRYDSQDRHLAYEKLVSDLTLASLIQYLLPTSKAFDEYVIMPSITALKVHHANHSFQENDMLKLRIIT